ncbi:hypothetical protein Tco_1063885 [Tanacetum coccineum]
MIGKSFTTLGSRMCTNRLPSCHSFDVTACASFVSALSIKPLFFCAFSTSTWLDSLSEPLRVLDLTILTLLSWDSGSQNMGDDVDINTLTMEQYLALIQGNIRPSIVKLKIDGDVKFVINDKFMRSLRHKLLGIKLIRLSTAKSKC